MSRLNFVVVQMLSVLLGCMLASGCMGSSSEVSATGKLLINGQPIENVLVKFHPVASPDEEKSIASGVTDADGRFVLMHNSGKSEGAIVGMHVVTLTEGPIPESIQNSKTPLAVETYMAGLKYRPLPIVYERHVDSTLKIEVKNGRDKYDLDIGGKQ